MLVDAHCHGFCCFTSSLFHQLVCYLLTYLEMKFALTVDVLLRPTGDAPIMKKRKWTVERTKKISSVIDFVRKYLKFEPQDSLVRSKFPLMEVGIATCFVR